MKITDVKTYLLNVPCGKLISDSARTLDTIYVLVVKIQADEVLGTGYTYTLKEGRLIKALADQKLKKVVVDQNPSDVEKIWRDMCHATNVKEYREIATNSVAAFDIALWDLRGKITGKPLYRLLGGTKNRMPIYDTDNGWLHYTPNELASNASKVVEQGFKGMKIKVGKKDMREDIERIRAVREVVGDNLMLMVDANQGYNIVEAIRRGKEFEKFNVYWLEEPIRDDDVNGHAKIADALDIRIAAGEWLYFLDDFKQYVEKKAVEIIQADVCRTCGITQWIEIANLAKSHGIPLAPHFVMDLHVHLTCAFPNGLIIEHMPWFTKLFKNPANIRDGYIEAPDRPGHGVEFTEEALTRFQIA